HLGYFLLTNLLLDILKSSAPSRIVNVASEAQNTPGYLNFDDLQNQQNYRAFFVYGQSKLCNVLFTYELAKRLAGTGVTANCLHPGVVATGFGSNAKGILGLLIKIARPFFISAQKGAQTIIYLSTSPEVEAVTGKYFIKCKERSSNRFSYDSTAAKRLWEISEELVNIRFHGENLSK
ncbi:MAG: SDR family NAD(P)-dependent oxidoreductase, partial [Blastocatellia bacterium]|nr:SDR family NAD(P)-dependent oxidoreductase [Blastocatellia bacterium]